MQSDIKPAHINAQEQIRAIRENDENVLKHFYQLNYPKVERYVLDNSGTADEAKDIFQEAFLAMWRNIQLGKFKAGEAFAISAYVIQIAKNKWIDQLRTRKNKHIVDIEEYSLNGRFLEPLPAENEEYIETVIKEFISLGQRCRDILNRFYYQKQSIREIAKSYNWTEPSAKNNKYRCLEELRMLVKNKIQK